MSIGEAKVPTEHLLAQPRPLLTFQHPSGEVVTWGEFDPGFLRASGIGPISWDQPMRVELLEQQSKLGNIYFSYEQNGLPLPDGMETEICLDGVRLQAGQVGQSKRGNPTRCYLGTLLIGGLAYEVTA